MDINNLDIGGSSKDTQRHSSPTEQQGESMRLTQGGSSSSVLHRYISGTFEKPVFDLLCNHFVVLHKSPAGDTSWGQSS